MNLKVHAAAAEVRQVLADLALDLQAGSPQSPAGHEPRRPNSSMVAAPSQGVSFRAALG